MTEEKIKEYSLRISQCSRTELVVITDEIVINYIDAAKEAFCKGDIEEFRFCIKKAEQFINELSSALDMKYEISGQLIQIYSYIRSCLIRADIRQSADELDAVKGFMEKLMNAFAEVAKSDRSGSVIENSQKVYAGLTYGPGSKLNEVVF